MGNDTANAVDPSGLAKRENIQIDKVFTFGVDRGSEVRGGFEIHVYKNGKEVAKINGYGGWADKHGGKKLPYKPSELRKKFPNIQARLRKQLKAEVRQSIKAGWRPGLGGAGRAVSGALLAFGVMSQTACSLDAVGNGKAYGRLLKALQEGEMEQANKYSNDLYMEILSAHDSHMALQWKAYWDEARVKANEDMYSE